MTKDVEQMHPDAPPDGGVSAPGGDRRVLSREDALKAGGAAAGLILGG